MALGLALLLAVALFFAAYFLSRPNATAEMFRRSATAQNPSAASSEFIFFTILAFLYLMWASLPLSIGSNKQFDPGRLLMYPISLRKLFAIDFLSEVTTLQSVFALPAILAMSIGAGLARGELTSSLLAAVPVAAFGLALSKWLSTAIGSLVRSRRARGETILALVGAIAGLGGALAGQVAPILFKHAAIPSRPYVETPPGAAAFLLAIGSRANPFGYLLASVALSCYTIILVIATFWIARRAALGLGGDKRRKVLTMAKENLPPYTGWQLPLLPDDLSAVVEKELRYAMRNAQLRMMSIMPLILVVIRLVNTKRFGSGVKAGAAHSFLTYASPLMSTGGVLYVFLILAGLSCNLFAFEEGGMRTLILSPIDRSKILIGKNIAITAIAVAFSAILLIINGIVFRDLSAETFLFAALSFVTFAAIMSVLGNSFSIRFPKRMQYGKRLNVSGVAGLLLIPVLLLLAVPPLASALAGYFTRSLLIEYATLAAFAALSVGFYFLLISFQGRALERREIEILEAVGENRH